jgi:hypothetical protein
MVPVVFVFRADYCNPARDAIISEIENVRSTVADQQVLTLFQCESLQVHPVSVMDTALDLLTTHARLADAANLARTGVPLVNVKLTTPN